MNKQILNLLFSVFIINTAFSQGNSCADPIDLNPLVPITGNGKINIDVDNTLSGKFYTYTATQVGIIEMSSAWSNDPGNPNFDTWLRVYDSNCNLIFDEDDTPGLFGGVEFSTNVAIGDSYIFEWVNHEWAGDFRVEFTYHVPVTGTTCDSPDNLYIGVNTPDNWFGAKYYTYTAPNDGSLTISTCEDPFAYYRNSFVINTCGGSNLATRDYSCDTDDNDLHTATYTMTGGETVIIKMEGYIHMHHDYNFTASFDSALSTNDEFYTSFEIYPNPVENNLFIRIDDLNKVKNISLYDLSGKEVSIDWGYYSSLEIKVDLQSIKAGVYILKINDSAKKLIKI